MGRAVDIPTSRRIVFFLLCIWIDCSSSDQASATRAMKQDS